MSSTKFEKAIAKELHAALGAPNMHSTRVTSGAAKGHDYAGACNDHEMRGTCRTRVVATRVTAVALVVRSKLELSPDVYERFFGSLVLAEE